MTYVSSHHLETIKKGSSTSPYYMHILNSLGCRRPFTWRFQTIICRLGNIDMWNMPNKRKALHTGKSRGRKVVMNYMHIDVVISCCCKSYWKGGGRKWCVPGLVYSDIRCQYFRTSFCSVAFTYPISKRRLIKNLEILCCIYVKGGKKSSDTRKKW